MIITKEYIEQKIDVLQKAADKLKNDSLANQGAADVLRLVLADLGKPESTIKE